jgi:hypothetical protein
MRYRKKKWDYWMLNKRTKIIFFEFDYVLFINYNEIWFILRYKTYEKQIW